MRTAAKVVAICALLFLAISTHAQTTVRVVAGQSTPYTDSKGQVWAADNGFSSASAAYHVSTAITNTPDPAIYQSVRYGTDPANPLTYIFPVANGSYSVNLKFAEIYWTGVNGQQGAGQRIFNVTINGTQVLMNFDIFADVGAAFEADDKSFPISVTGGSITIQFIPVTPAPPDTHANVSAIEIVPSGGCPACPPPTFTPVTSTNDAPFINSITPSSGVSGTQVTIVGGNFTINTSIKFTFCGTQVNAAVTFVSTTKLTAIVPNPPSGCVP